MIENNNHLALFRNLKIHVQIEGVLKANGNDMRNTVPTMVR